MKVFEFYLHSCHHEGVGGDVTGFTKEVEEWTVDLLWQNHGSRLQETASQGEYIMCLCNIIILCASLQCNGYCACVFVPAYVSQMFMVAVLES